MLIKNIISVQNPVFYSKIQEKVRDIASFCSSKSRDIFNSPYLFYSLLLISTFLIGFLLFDYYEQINQINLLSTNIEKQKSEVVKLIKTDLKLSNSYDAIIVVTSFVVIPSALLYIFAAISQLFV